MIIENSSNWLTTKIKFISTVISGGTPQSTNPDYWDGSVPWLTPVDLGKKGSEKISSSDRKITDAGVAAAGLSILPVGSIVISTRAPIGSMGLIACEATTNQGCKAIVPDSRKIESKFAYYFTLNNAEKFGPVNFPVIAYEFAANCNCSEALAASMGNQKCFHW